MLEDVSSSVKLMRASGVIRPWRGFTVGLIARSDHFGKMCGVWYVTVPTLQKLGLSVLYSQWTW